MVIPGNIVKLTSAPDETLADTDLYFALVSKEFMSGIRFDFQKVFQDSLRVLDNPCLTLDDEQVSMAEDYFQLARKALQSNQPNRQEMLGALLTSFIYMTLGVWTTRLEESGELQASARVPTQPRRRIPHFGPYLRDGASRRRGIPQNGAFLRDGTSEELAGRTCRF
ncbi:MAG: hypothetical protein J6X99_01285 [Bacteroidales bacterium]|nr:hypothetical protein [Bacteroidales bacterium]